MFHVSRLAIVRLIDLVFCSCLLRQACLVSGETGCGKSTQVPQFLLDDPGIGPSCKIVCTQPRRISAIAVAERIAEERGESIGGTVRKYRSVWGGGVCSGALCVAPLPRTG